MVLELLFLALLVLGLCIMAYRGAVHEFQILQRDFDADINWAEILDEQLPLVIRNIPRSWTGAWNSKVTGNKQWQIYVRTDGRKFKTTWANWLATPAPRPELVSEASNTIRDVSRLGLSFSNWGADGFRRWSWLPSAAPTPFVFHPGKVHGVRKVTAEYAAIVSTDGAPLELWIAHEGAIPASVQSEIVDKDPWVQTTEEIPWIGEVKYIEIKLRPGNAVLIPRHWWVSVRAAEGEKTDAWFWIGEFNTPISWVATKLAR